MIKRLLGIVYVLLNKGHATASELAERFEVSVRTIYRDVEVLSQAGIPVYTQKGKNGGIWITEQFVLNKMLLTDEEQQQILSALISLRETKALDEQVTLQKLCDFFKAEPVSWLAIDFSEWGDDRKQFYEEIKTAILECRVISFDYFGRNREISRRKVEPIQLLFKEYTWYLRAYCRERKVLRLFKLLRMKRLQMLDEKFLPRMKKDIQILEDIGNQEEMCKELTAISLWIDKKEACRVYEHFRETELQVNSDGNFTVNCSYYLDEWVYSLILSFGASAKVLAPEHVKIEIQNRILDMMKNYNLH